MCCCVHSYTGPNLEAKPSQIFQRKISLQLISFVGKSSWSVWVSPPPAEQFRCLSSSNTTLYSSTLMPRVLWDSWLQIIRILEPNGMQHFENIPAGSGLKISKLLYRRTVTSKSVTQHHSTKTHFFSFLCQTPSNYQLPSKWLIFNWLTRLQKCGVYVRLNQIFLIVCRFICTSIYLLPVVAQKWKN